MANHEHIPTSITIRNALLAGRSLTALDIADEFRTPHGATYIHNWRKKGMHIISERIPGSTKVRYFIEKSLLSQEKAKFGFK